MKKKTKNILTKKGANFFGLEEVGSDGKKKRIFVVRGNGTLILNQEDVVFKRWLPPKSFTIPIKSISKLDIERAHNLKTKLFPVLKIHYREETKTKFFGVCIGFLDETYQWREQIAKTRTSYLQKGKNAGFGGHSKE